MKRFLTCLFVASISLSGVVLFAQSYSRMMKERQEIARSSKKDLNEKASKAAKSEAKKLRKQGWETAPGALPLERQLDKSYLMQYEYDFDGSPMFLMAEGMSVGGNYDAAKMQALELAKQNLAGQIESEISAFVKNTVGNNQSDQGGSASIANTVMASKNKISQSIGRVMPIVETYRVVNGNMREVLVRIAYSMKQAKSIANRVIHSELEHEGSALHEKLDKAFGE